MKRLLYFSFVCCSLIFSVNSQAEVQVDKGMAQVDGETFHHSIAYDDAIAGKRPGIIVVHEWWGLNDYALKRMNMLAELGYVAIAIDMYGQGKTVEHPKDAKALATELRKDMKGAADRFTVAMDTLKQHPQVDAKNIAAIGYCLGGGVVLNMARKGMDLKSVVSFHGGLSSSIVPEKGGVKAKILVCHGEEDKSITAQIPEFEATMTQVGADYELIIYPNATHSWTNPAADQVAKNYNFPIRYNPWADRKSWADMLVFLDKHFTN